MWFLRTFPFPTEFNCNRRHLNVQRSEVGDYFLCLFDGGMGMKLNWWKGKALRKPRMGRLKHTWQGQLCASMRCIPVLQNGMLERVRWQTSSWFCVIHDERCNTWPEHRWGWHPPCVLRTALFWPCVLRTAYRLTIKTTILAFPFT